MQRTMFSKLTSSIIAITHLVISVLFVIPNVSHAQDTDFDPPSIELSSVDEGIRGDNQVFTAVVTDDNLLSSVTLRYRFDGQIEYKSVAMDIIEGTDIYSASVSTADTQASLIQFYLEAKDAGGNRTVQGFAFEPLERTLLEPVAPVTEIAVVVPEEEPAPSVFNTRNIIYAVLGVVAVGGLAASMGGSSNGGGGNTPIADGDDGEVELTILVDGFQ